MNTFVVNIPMIDHPLVVEVRPRQDANNSYELYYNNELCGGIFCNEHNIWIYEPHHHAALLLNEDQIEHLGAEIGRHTK